MLKTIKKYSILKNIPVVKELAEKVRSHNKGVCEQCSSYAKLYNAPFSHFGLGAKVCIYCLLRMISR